MVFHSPREVPLPAVTSIQSCPMEEKGLSSMSSGACAVSVFFIFVIVKASAEWFAARPRKRAYHKHADAGN